jgi:hypothetical protein
MTTRTERFGKMDLFTLNSGKVVSVDWEWKSHRFGYEPDFPYGFQDEAEANDVDLTTEEVEEVFGYILAEIPYDPDCSWDY